MLRKSIILCKLVIILFPSAAIAGNLNFLKDAPMAHMTAEDTELLRNSIQQVLNEADDGQTQEWKNPATGHGGSLSPVKTYSAYKTQCRTLKIVNQAGGETGNSQFDFCRDKDKSWKVLK